MNNGQVSLMYKDDLSIVGQAFINGEWISVEGPAKFGQWTNYVLTRSSENLSLFINGVLQQSTDSVGVLSFSTVGDMFIATSDRLQLSSSLELDDFRIYQRALNEEEVQKLFGHGAGDIGIRPLISGSSPFILNPTLHNLSFIENNNTLLRTEVTRSAENLNLINGSLISFSDDNFSYIVNTSDDNVNLYVSIPYGFIEKDGNISQAVAYEFLHRQITSVEDGLVAWYPFDEHNGSKFPDISGNLRHSIFHGLDATQPGDQNISSSETSATSYPKSNAFDNSLETADDKWLARWEDNDIDLTYNFGASTEVGSYAIYSQNADEDTKSPKSWILSGSNDNSTWTELDSVGNQTDWDKWEGRIFGLPETANYKHYRFTFTSSVSSLEFLSLGEIELFSPVNLETGLSGNAISLDGERLDLPFRVDQSSKSNGLTAAFWLKPDYSNLSNDQSVSSMLLSSDDGGSDWSLGFSGKYPSLRSGLQTLATPRQVLASEWIHLAVTFDPKVMRSKIFINGVEFPFNSLGFDESSGRIIIGSDQEGSDPFVGLLDDARIWNRALSHSEVLSLYGNGLGDLGPNASISASSPVYEEEISAIISFNQIIDDFDATSDLSTIGLDWTRTETEDNQTFTLFFTPDSFNPSDLQISLMRIQSLMYTAGRTPKYRRLLITGLLESQSPIF